MSLRHSFLTLLLIGLSVAAFRPTISLSPRTRSIYGRVIDAGTGKPIDGVTVAAVGVQVGSAVKANGAFTMNNVPGDASRIEFRHPCYLPVQVMVARDADVEIEIGLPFDQTSLQRPGCGGLGERKKG